MSSLTHLSCGRLHAPPGPPAVCHCLLLEASDSLVLVDTGIGLLDVADPAGRLGQEVIEVAGFTFDPEATAARQIEALGFSPGDVTDIVLTHCDPDHAGGLADFPTARVHVSAVELGRLLRGNPRYSAQQFAHAPRWQPYYGPQLSWFGLPARRLAVPWPDEMLLVSLPGHTIGHSGVALFGEGKWLLHAGDAYYLRGELDDDSHPVAALAALRADHDPLRRSTLGQIRRLLADHGDQVEVFAYHDPSELPPGPG